ELPQLTERRHGWVLKPHWAWAGVAAALLVAVFLLGRYSTQKQSPINVASNAGVTTASPTQQVRERVLLFAVGDHLERSQMLLQLGHQPSRLTSGDLKRIQDSIQSQGILFKVRVVRANVRKESAQRPRTASSPKKGQTT